MKIKNRVPREFAEKVVEPIIKELELVGKILICGSYRRKKSIVGDIDIVGVKREMIDVLLKYGQKGSAGEKNASIVLDRVQVDLWVVPEESFIPAIMFATGSAIENIRLRSKAKGNGWKLNQYGLWEQDRNIIEGFPNEEMVYEMLGEEYKEPENR